MIDEVGYLTYGPEAANVLFHVVNDRHLRKRPMVFTTNKPLNEWGKVLHDEDMAAAILDRVLERGRFVHLDGPSGRTRHLNLEEVLPTSPERVRISGISGSEFPEPTLPGTITKNYQKYKIPLDIHKPGGRKCLASRLVQDPAQKPAHKLLRAGVSLGRSRLPKN